MARRSPAPPPLPLPGDSLLPAALFRRYLPEALPPVRTPAYFGPTDIAAAQIDAGQYRRALYTLFPLPAGDAAAAVLRARARVALGEIDAARAALAPAGLETDPGVRLERARLLARTDPRGAMAALTPLVGEAPEAVAEPARLDLARLLELTGDTAGALSHYRVLARPLDDPDLSAGQLVLRARATDRLAALTSAYRNNPDLDRTILAAFVRAYDVLDPGNADAHLAAAEYLLSHDNADLAVEEFGAVFKLNPRHPAAWALFGRTVLKGFDFDRCDLAVARLREVDPASVDADLLEARSFLVQRRVALAEPLIASVLARRPGDLTALGLLASAQAVRLDEAGMRATLARADAVSPTSPVAVFEVAVQLGLLRQYDRAAELYKQALARAPWWTEPRNELGLLYTQSGDEALARDVLEEARTLDPFNARTTNYLRLLDKLSGMATLKGKHFEVFTDAETDPFLAPLLLEYLESVHADLAATFEYEPAVTTLIEVFPRHSQFSVRTTGTPWIGTVGASTGRVIAMVAPRDGAETLGTFNWAQVLRHEYTHTITLGATANRIPHWMTEGLAVWAERSPLRWEWVPMLYRAVRTGTLFDLDRLTWGFVRPKKPSDRSLAYAQSYWMCRYLIDTYGRQSMLDLLAQFRAGKTQDQAFEAVLHKPISTFYEEFLAYARKETDTWGYDEISSATYDALREEGEARIASKDFKAAAEIWEQIARLRPVDALPHQRLAGLYLTPALSDPSKARKHLEVLASVELKDNRYYKRLARLAEKQGDLPAALAFARSALYVSPYDRQAHELLLDLATKSGDTALADLQRQRLSQLAPLDARRQKDNDIPRDAPTAPVAP